MALFQNNPEVSNLESTTYYAMGEKCAEVSNMLVHFDEYKNSLSNKHIDFLKGVYDNAGRSKRSSDGEHREATKINCGVLITGQEMPTADIALFSRVIFLESQKSERSKEETDKYQKFLKLRNMCPTNITVGLMRYRENFNAGWYDAWKRSLREIKSEVDYNVIGERFINNWAMMLASYYCLKSFAPACHLQNNKFMTFALMDFSISILFAAALTKLQYSGLCFQRLVNWVKFVKDKTIRFHR